MIVTSLWVAGEAAEEPHRPYNGRSMPSYHNILKQVPFINRTISSGSTSSAHERLLRSGAAAINHWRAKNPNSVLHAANIDLSSLDLSGADLSNGDFRDSSFRHANLTEVNFSQSNSEARSRFLWSYAHPCFFLPRIDCQVQI
jgi:hypothetical protein